MGVSEIYAASETNLGGIDIWRYCNSIDNSSASLVSDDWKCQPSNVNANLNTACRYQYSNPQAFAKQDAAGNPYSWSCYISDAISQDAHDLIPDILAKITNFDGVFTTILTKLSNIQTAINDQSNRLGNPLDVDQVDFTYAGFSSYGPTGDVDFSDSRYRIEITPVFKRNNSPDTPNIEVTTSGSAQFQYDGPLYLGTGFGPTASNNGNRIIIETPLGVGGGSHLDPINVILNFTLKHPNGEMQYESFNLEVPLDNIRYTNSSNENNLRVHKKILHF